MSSLYKVTKPSIKPCYLFASSPDDAIKIAMRRFDGTYQDYSVEQRDEISAGDAMDNDRKGGAR